MVAVANPRAPLARRPAGRPSAEARPAPAPRPEVPAPAAERGTPAQRYPREDLYAVAELGYHYLMNGGVALAHALFDGLVAIAPEEAYFARALGLALDKLDDRPGAMRAYQRAAELDPGDPRALINLAELRLERGEREQALRLLEGGRQRARARGEVELERKAKALLVHLSTAEVR